MALELTSSITGRAEILRLIQEFEEIDVWFVRAARTATKSAQPVLSRLMQRFVQDNRIAIEDRGQREHVHAELQRVLNEAPVVTLSFAYDPPATVVHRLTQWFRRNASGEVLIAVSIQPDIAGGCVVRTRGHQYDYSLRHVLTKTQSQLISAVKKAAA